MYPQSTLAQTVPATMEKPLYIESYPMYRGAFCPHKFWHVTVPAHGNTPHREEIWFSMYRRDYKDTPSEWSKPKRMSHPKATICLITINTSTIPHKVSFSSIYLPDTSVPPIQYAAHPEHVPHTSASHDLLHTNPTGQDLFQFFTNPTHYFTIRQLQLLSSAMVKYFPSDYREYQQAHQLWSPSNPDKPVPLQDWASTPLAPLGIPAAALPLLIVHTSFHRPYLVDSYPFNYGIFRPARFWIEITRETKVRQYREVGYMQTLDPATNQWTAPKAVSPAKGSICLMHIEKTPGHPNFGLPYFTAINLVDEKRLTVMHIVDFATHPDHYFTAEQRERIWAALPKDFEDADSAEVRQVREAWATKPLVPSVPA